MNWKQTIGLVVSVGAIIALCFLVVFPALYDKEEPRKGEVQKKSETPRQEDDRSVLPKLKGVNWETAPQAQRSADKKPAKKEEHAPVEASVPETEEPEAVEIEELGPAALLELQEMTWYEQEGYVVVAGTVKNISGSTLPAVQAHVSFEGDDEWLISEENAMIDLNPIFPDQISPFTVISRYYPEITNVVIDFRKFSGESIPWSKVEVEEPVELEGQEESDQSPHEDLFAPEGETETVGPN